LASHANRMAERLARGIAELGYTFQTDSPTNQIFPILPKPLIDQLMQAYSFYVWEEVDAGHAAIRLVTSWATPSQAVDGFLTSLAKLSS